MYAVVCGKRSSSIFADELVPPSPPSPHSSHHHHPAKRSRCSPHCSFDAHRREALLHQLLSFFPDMDPQLLERALEASGDDLDSAIKSLNELRLESAEAILSATGCKSENGLPTAVQPSVEGTGRDLFRFIMHLLHQARKKTEISKLTTDEHKEVASNALCMWTKEDVDRAEARMLKVFRAVQTGPWVS